MPWLAAVTGKNRTMTLYEIRHTLFSAFSESLFAKNQIVYVIVIVNYTFFVPAI